jgi:tetratricopeptide (TPR) repeat protein
MNSNDLSGAIAALRRASAADPDWALPDVALAGALSYKNDLAGALDAAHHAQRLEPAWWQAVAAGARAFAAAKQTDDMIQEYRRALALAPDNAVLLAEVALAYHNAGMDAEADRYGDRALALDDALASVHLMRAERRLEQGDGSGAAAEAERVLAVSPKNPGAYLARGDAFALRGDKPQAFAAYRRAIELAGESSTSLPDDRVRAVRAAMDRDELPPPRGVASNPPEQRSHPGPPTAKPPPAHSDPPPGRPQPERSHPSSPTKPSNATRSRPGCGPGDPSCSLDL